MISTNFIELNDDLKTFILSVAVGSEEVIDKLLDTVNRHLCVLESLQLDSPNLKLHFETSVHIINQAYTSLLYINHHSADLFRENPLEPVVTQLEAIENRFGLVLKKFKENK